MTDYDADLLDDVIARLWRVRSVFGSGLFQTAGHAALAAIGAAVLEEAERQAGVRTRPEATVVRFPIGRRPENRASQES